MTQRGQSPPGGRTARQIQRPLALAGERRIGPVQNAKRAHWYLVSGEVAGCSEHSRYRLQCERLECLLRSPYICLLAPGLADARRDSLSGPAPACP